MNRTCLCCAWVALSRNLRFGSAWVKPFSVSMTLVIAPWPDSYSLQQTDCKLLTNQHLVISSNKLPCSVVWICTSCPCFLTKAGTSEREPWSESKTPSCFPAGSCFSVILTLTRGSGQRKAVKSINSIMILLSIRDGHYPNLRNKPQVNGPPVTS